MSFYKIRPLRLSSAWQLKEGHRHLVPAPSSLSNTFANGRGSLYFRMRGHMHACMYACITDRILLYGIYRVPMDKTIHTYTYRLCGKIFHMWHHIDPQNVLDFAPCRF